MAKRWTKLEETRYRNELVRLYVRGNLPLRIVAQKLHLSEQTAYKRLLRLNIQTQRLLKQTVNNRRTDMVIPSHSGKLAEFIGVMLGDGHLSKYQTVVTLGSKEFQYVQYVAELMKSLFRTSPHILARSDGYRDVYIGSTELSTWLRDQGLSSNKVKDRVDVPEWIFGHPSYMKACLRGFFDTDGSIYKLRHGVQISLTNRSVPLLHSLQRMLRLLGYSVSEATLHRVYITRKTDVIRFFREIVPANKKHQKRFMMFMRRSDSGNSRRL